MDDCPLPYQAISSQTLPGPILKPKREPSATLTVAKSKPTEPVNDENDRKSRVRDVQVKAKKLFPIPTWQRKVEVLIPKATPQNTNIMQSSPFLLAMNKDKLTPFQEVKAFQKTRKLMLQQGISLAQQKINQKISSKKLIGRNEKTQMRNQQIMRLTTQQRLTVKRQTTHAISTQPLPSVKVLTPQRQSLPAYPNLFDSVSTMKENTVTMETVPMISSTITNQKASEQPTD